MPSTFHDRSSLFLLCRSRSTSASTDEYTFQATEANRNTAHCLRGVSATGVPPLPARGRLAAAVSRATAATETTFFVDLPGLTSLVCCALPALLSSRPYSPKLRIWCAGCATGQGAYSLAMTLAELCPGMGQWNIEIVASDADATSLWRARRGVYTPSEVQCGLPTDWLVRHFEQLPVGGCWRVSSQLARQMTWIQLDISQSCAAVGTTDIIFCHQNLGCAQFDSRRRRELLDRMTGQLAPDGFLILQSADAALERDPRFARVGAGDAALYRRLSSEDALLIA
ncbi:MAG TPA: CheR family methyltransferase [Planctomycetaceae bacterium]|nr:CheR family methyltransferase [Planctomycetaceae bacterium]